MRTIRVRRWSGRVVLLAGLLAATMASPASAMLPPSPGPTQSGKVGPHHLVDGEAHPGARCHYPETPNHVDRIHVEPPVAKARHGHAHQRIGFRYVIKGWDGTKLKDVVVSDFQYRSATPTSAAAFTGRTAHIDDIHHPYGHYLVRVDLRWYDAAGHVMGKTSDYVLHYDVHWIGNPPDSLDIFCNETTG